MKLFYMNCIQQRPILIKSASLAILITSLSNFSIHGQSYTDLLKKDKAIEKIENIATSKMVASTDVNLDAATSVLLTFRVDMSNELAFTNIGLRGSWSDWTTTHILTSTGNNIFEITLAQKSDTFIEYKFVKLDETNEIIEWENIPDKCGTGEYNNRYITVPSGTQTLDIVFFNTCPIHTLTLDDVYFEDGTIKYYWGNYENIIIPPSFRLSDIDQVVTTIVENVFYDKSLTSVIIPNSVTTIESGAFSCNALTNVILPNNITSIGAGAFFQNSLTSITIPNGIISIGTSAFWGNSLTSLTIPNSITSIEDYTFFKNSLTNINIPNSVTSIEKSAFRSNSLTSLTIPNNVISIGNWAFGDNSLTNIVIPNSVTYIGQAAFNNNVITEINGETSNGIIYARNNNGSIDNTTLVSYGGAASIIDFIPNEVKTIGANSFSNSSLSEVTLPGNLNEILGSSFSDNSLTSINIPNGVTTIESSAFKSNAITNLTLPDYVTSIGSAAFNNNSITQLNGETCNGIIYARNNDGTEDLTTIVSYGGVATNIDFIPNNVTKIGSQAFGFNTISNLILPSNILEIENRAFADNDLFSINIPSTINIIGDQAFYKNSLTNVSFNINSNLQLIGLGAFDNNTNLSTITLLTNLNSNFLGYKDSNGTEYNENDEISDFTLAYFAQLPSHTLTIDDIEFSNDTLLNYVSDYRNITFPTSFNLVGVDLDIATIKSNSFNYKQLTEIKLSNKISYIEAYAFIGNYFSSIALPAPIIKEGYTFIEWQDISGNTVTEITDFWTSYQAQFYFSGHMVSGKITLDDTESISLKGLKLATDINMEDISLQISGDITGIRPVNSDATYNFALNTGRDIVITPIKEGYTFTPASITVNNIQDDINNQNFTPLSTSIIEAIKKQVNIYPNPVSNILTSENIGQFQNASLLDIIGRILKTIDCRGSSIIQIDMQNYNKGVYMVKLSGTESNILKKIIKN